MGGSGYPRRLTHEQMSPVARMMAIADIFEALNAGMGDDQHIDPDLFDLILHAGVWRDYAERVLLPEHIDDVHLERFAAS